MVCEEIYVGSYSIGICSDDYEYNSTTGNELSAKNHNVQKLCLFDDVGNCVAGSFASCGEAEEFYSEMFGQSDQNSSMGMS